MRKPIIGAKYRCGNEMFGCRRMVDRAVYNFRLNACTACVGKAARKWQVRPDDLTMVKVAFWAARAVNGGVTPTCSQVWEILAKAGLQKQPFVPEPMRHASVDSCLPAGDRAEAA